MPFVLPVGSEDRADGVIQLPAQPSTPQQPGGSPHIIGTPLPTASIYHFANSQFPIEEGPGSPHSERAEQYTCEHTLTMSWLDTGSYLSVMPRGTVVTDTAGVVWKILSCDNEPLNGTLGRLHYVMECISGDTPPDEFEIIPSSLDLNIIKHPRYWWALCPYDGDGETYATVGDTDVSIKPIKEVIIRAIQNYIESPFYPSSDQVNGLIQNNILQQLNDGKLDITIPISGYDPDQTLISPPRWDGKIDDLPSGNYAYAIVSVPVNLSDPDDPVAIAVAAAKEIISKLWRGEETPSLEVYEVHWTQKFYQPVYLNPGGYTEDPREWIPDYFLNPANGYGGLIMPRGQSAGGNNNEDSVDAGHSGSVTIFDLLTVINPQSYSVTGKSGGPLLFSSLRKADSYSYQNNVFTVIHTWLVATVGAWDSDLYPEYGVDGPQNADDFNRDPLNRSDI
jgi:hypothetical protein